MSRALEIVLWVFESLDNIDDALHLARCCKCFSIFDATGAVEVFRIYHRKDTLIRHVATTRDGLL